MSVGRLAAASVAASLFAAAAGAQTPGTLEVGGYGQYTIFDDRGGTGGPENKVGVGGRVGVFFSPRWSLEGEASSTTLEFDNNARNNDDINHYSPIALRLNYNFPFATNSAFILGAGVTRSDYGFQFNYGPSAMAGARVGLGRVFALRLDGVYNYLPDENVKLTEIYLRAGLSALIPGAGAMTAEQQAQMGGAPQPGTVELGAFGQYSKFDNDMGLDNSFGYGARIGTFVTPMLEPEVDFSYSEADQSEGVRAATNLHVVPVAARLNFNFPFGARNAFILGAGATRTFYQMPGSPYYRGVDEENNAGGTYHWGPSGLAGVRIGFGQRVALRLDGVADYLVEPKFANFAARAGLSLLLGGARPAEPPPPPPVAMDTTTPPPPPPPAPVEPDTAGQGLRQAQEAARSALQAVIYFDFDRSNIRQDAATTLDAKIPYLQANPQMRIRIVGNTDPRGSDEYNLALGQRRAASARRYLTQRGIDASRIEITSRGEESLVCTETNEECYQRNRRDEFEIVVGGENIMVPGQTGGNMMPSPSAAPSSNMMMDSTQMRDSMMGRDSSMMMRDSSSMMMRDTMMTPDSSMARDTSMASPSGTLAPAQPDTLNSTTAPAREPSAPMAPGTTTSPSMPMDTTATPLDTTATPRDTTATPRDTTATPRRP